MADTTVGSERAAVAPSADVGLEPRRRSGRLLGVDVARAIALGGMLLAHYASPEPERRAADPGWLRAIDQAADGRAAPLFCVLLGVSAGLLAARGARDREFVVRGALLMAVGLFIWPYAQAVSLILPHYGLLLMAVPLLRRIPRRLLVPAALVAFAIPTLAAAVMGDDRLRHTPQPDGWGDLLDVAGLVRLLTWTGAYPLVGWVGFVLVGLWLARRALGDRATQLRLLAGGVAIALVQPLVSLVADVPADPPGGLAEGWNAVLDGSAHANRFLWYVLATATAVAVVAACLLVVDRRGRGRVTPLVALGQCALSAYLAHLVIGAELVWPWQDRDHPSLVAQVGVTLAVYLSFAVAATLWRRHHTHGPAEAGLRAAVALVR